jgi:hypothetical protein
MDNIVESWAERGFNASIQYDMEASNPREDFGPFCHMAVWHRRYILGDKDQREQFRDPDSFDEWYADNEKGVAIIKKVWMYDHSGIAISTSRMGQFVDPWDSGQIGYVYVTKEDICEEWSVKRVSKKLLKLAEKILDSEVETYDLYLRGEVYYVHVEHIDTGECNGCGGYYGVDDAKNAVKELIDDWDNWRSADTSAKEISNG